MPRRLWVEFRLSRVVSRSLESAASVTAHMHLASTQSVACLLPLSSHAARAAFTPCCGPAHMAHSTCTVLTAEVCADIVRTLTEDEKEVEREISEAANYLNRMQKRNTKQPGGGPMATITTPFIKQQCQQAQ